MAKKGETMEPPSTRPMEHVSSSSPTPSREKGDPKTEEVALHILSSSTWGKGPSSTPKVTIEKRPLTDEETKLLSPFLERFNNSKNINDFVGLVREIVRTQGNQDTKSHPALMAELHKLEKETVKKTQECIRDQYSQKFGDLVSLSELREDQVLAVDNENFVAATTANIGNEKKTVDQLLKKFEIAWRSTPPEEREAIKEAFIKVRDNPWIKSVSETDDRLFLALANLSLKIDPKGRNPFQPAA
jgi:hypothetical protein